MEKVNKQRFTNNDGFARDRETSQKNAMFLQVEIVYLFSIIKQDLETKHIWFSNVKLAALRKFKNDEWTS